MCLICLERIEASKRDTTFLVDCISRRLAEMIAGCKENTEPEIFKEALSSTQVVEFLAYGELSFTHLLQEPYVYNFSCWGMTFRSEAETRAGSQPVRAEPSSKKEKALGIKGWLKGTS